MGMGDEILALGEAELLYEARGYPVQIVGVDSMPRSHELWQGNPAIATKDSPTQKRISLLRNGPGARSYLKSITNGVSRFNMNHYPRAGTIYLTEEERSFCPMDPDSFIVIEPTVKPGASPNKSWGWDRWAAVAARMNLPVYQLGSGPARTLPGVHRLQTPTTRLAAAVIERAALVLCNEGGTHHLAAAMRRPAVVVFGGFTPPSITGYPFHKNITGPEPHGFCGKWDSCQHCTTIMASINPDMVVSAAQELVGHGIAS